MITMMMSMTCGRLLMLERSRLALVILLLNLVLQVLLLELLLLLLELLLLELLLSLGLFLLERVSRSRLGRRVLLTLRVV